MARPKKAEEDKKHVLNIRVAFQTKIEVEAAAERDGIPVSHKAEQLIEKMLNLSDDADAETLELLSDIVQEIQTVQSLTGNKWHNDLATWAAVSEIFKGSPIRRKKPNSSMDDPSVNKAWAAYMQLARERESLITMMTKFDIAIDKEPLGRYGGIVTGGIFGNRPPLKNREIEAAAIAKIEDDSTRAKAEAIFSMICDADEQIKTAYDNWSEAVEPYHEQEREGRQRYKAYRREMALETLRNGGFPDIEDL